MKIVAAAKGLGLFYLYYGLGFLSGCAFIGFMAGAGLIRFR